MRCKHKNGMLYEWVEAAHTRRVIDGVMESKGVNELGQILYYEYRCAGCKKRWRYVALNGHRLPQWLRSMHMQLAETERTT